MYPSSVLSVTALLLALGSIAGCAGTPAVSDRCEQVSNGHSPKQIALFFDGTWNDEGDRTNVFKFYEQVKENQKTLGCARIRAYYDPGVGSDWRRLTGGAFGYGFSRNVRDAYTWLAGAYVPGDKIYVFGFSRGAFTARAFAVMIQQVGVLNRNAYSSAEKSEFRNDVEELFKIVKQSGQEESERCGEPFWTWNDLWWRKTAQEALSVIDGERRKRIPGAVTRHVTQIEAVAVWDTVAALGRTHGAPEPKYMITVEDLPSLRRAYQALAIDESRPNFSPVLWSSPKKEKCSKPTSMQLTWPRATNGVIEEVWFPGAHSDVGGGYGSEPALSPLSLNWMADKFRADGLVSDYFGKIDSVQRMEIARRGVRHSPKGSALGERLFAPGVAGVRRLYEGASIHASVCDRVSAAHDPVETGDLGAYRPCSLFKEGKFRHDLVVSGEANCPQELTHRLCNIDR